MFAKVGGFLQRLRRDETEGCASCSFFAQEGEDAVLAGLIDPEWNRKGFFVDVGAHHPTRFSNTWMFYQAGWRGINIDPTPGSMVPFRELRSEDVNLEVAISREAAVRKFYCYNEPALNGIDNDRREELKDTHYKLERILDIETLPLSEILKRHRERFVSPSFLTIDVEGLEVEVLSSVDLQKYSFDFILVEQMLPDLMALGKSDVWKYVTERGYKAVACTGRTVFYQRTGDVA
ncbi:methyltransferase, FkbM family [Terrimicrobium sacchariphilum]|uniref:Methyltransferase, FkbM family n=1 Tax=Terrimicrobium sacchariphilum TaxID=690879 RepID=A0A146G4N8_TERSA|nr:FkbM family methyltransferase [Terrimicrobium sacchariphilum]GAT31994.1 methyltransferase, FkbM family [Terrimicrobium sacchariphilum]